MVYKTYQAVILLKENLGKEKRNQIIKKVKELLEEQTKNLQIYACQDINPLALKQENSDNVWYIVMQFKVIVPGFIKRIKEIRKRLNTYSEILEYRFIQKGENNFQFEEQNKDVFVVYEFDYGDISEKVEPRITIFGVFLSKKQAEQKAYNLLLEGQEKYFISKIKKNLQNPFTRYDEVELYDRKDEENQESPIYYIKIEKIELE